MTAVHPSTKHVLSVVEGSKHKIFRHNIIRLSIVVWLGARDCVKREKRKRWLSTNEKIGRLKGEDLVDDRIVKKLEKEGVF